MADDIVTILQNECQCSDDCRAVNDPCIPMRAADEIERLRERLRLWHKLANDMVKCFATDLLDDYEQVVRGE